MPKLLLALSAMLLAIIVQCGTASTSSCDVREYNSLSMMNNPTPAQIAQEPAITHNSVAISGTHAESPAFNANTSAVWIQCPNVQACFEEGSPPTNATTGSSPLPTGAGGVFMGVKPGAQVSMIACTP